MNRLRILVSLLVLIWLASAPALAEKRVALVIGNSDYQHVQRLPNPVNDAADMAKALRNIGFDVTELGNLGRDDFEKALANFSDNAAGADLAVVYFAGHGIEVDRQNYLIPVDAVLETDRRLRFEAVNLDDVLGALDDVRGVRVVLIDACRNNPFSASMKLSKASRSVGRGLARIEAATGTVISFASKEGTIAADGAGRNSPFTAALLANIEEPGLEIQFLMRKVRDGVLAATGNEQEPFISASLSSEAIYFVPPKEGAATAGQTGIGSSTAADELVWRQLVASNDPNALASFVSAYPQSQHKPAAEKKIQELRTASLEAKLTPLAGIFYSRTDKLDLRQWPGKGEPIIGSVSGTAPMAVLGRIAGADPVDPSTKWYKLKLESGVTGYADERSVFNEIGYKTSTYLKESVELLKKAPEKVKTENRGKFVKYMGAWFTGHGFNNHECVNSDGTLLVGYVNFYWFADNKRYHFSLNDPHVIHDSTVTYYRKFKFNSKGNFANQTAQIYKFQFSDGESELNAYLSGHFIYDVSFTNKNQTINYRYGKSCGDIASVFERAVAQYEKQIANLEAEAIE